MKSYFALMICILTISFHIYGEMANSPIKFNYKQIPYGKNINEVKNMLKGATITEENDTSLYSINDFSGLIDYFDGGIYQFTYYNLPDPATYIKSSISKKYMVTYLDEINIVRINLFFYKNIKTKDYRLFLIEKILTNPSKNYNFVNYFQGLKKSMSKSIGKTPEIRETTFQNRAAEMAGVVNSAIFGIWNTATEKIYLLVSDNPFSYDGEEPRILYISISEWANYIKACKISVEAEKKKEQQNQNKDVDKATTTF